MLAATGLILLLALLPLSAAGAQTDGRSGFDTGKIDAAVWSALSSGAGFSADWAEPATEGVRVFVMLHPDGYDQSSPLQATKSQVASQRAAFLESMESSDYQQRSHVENVPALSGVVMSEQALAQMARDPNVQRVSLDNGGGSASLQDFVTHVGGDTAFANGFTGQGVTVAVLDSGIDHNHPSFNHITIRGEACYLPDGNSPCPNGLEVQEGTDAAEDDYGHGTFVTGIVAGNGSGVASRGMAVDVDVVPVKVLDSSGSFSSPIQILWALDFIYDNHPEVQVINMSFGTRQKFSGACDNANAWTQALAVSANRLRQRGTLLIAASGNDGATTAIGAPGCLSSVIAVGSSTLDDQFASYTSSSDQLQILAPGGTPANGVVGPIPGGGTRTAHGTSMASPMVAGCAALFFESGMSAAAVEDRLLLSDVQITNPGNGLRHPRLSCAVGEEPPLELVTLPGRTDGWLRAEGTRNWISADCRTQLEARGMTTRIVAWSMLSAIPDASPFQRCRTLIPELFGPQPADLITLPGRTDGWVRANGTRNWVSPDCRAQLQARGMAPEVVFWATLDELEDAIPHQRCGTLLIQLFGQQPRDLVTLSGRTDGWIRREGTRNWVSANCRAELESRGFVLRIVPWATLAGYEDAAPFLGCDDLIEQLFGQPSTN